MRFCKKNYPFICQYVVKHAVKAQIKVAMDINKAMIVIFKPH